MEMAWIALVHFTGTETGQAAAFIIGVERQTQSDGVFYAAHIAHAGVGLFSQINLLGSCNGG
jgi:hypothetical protein